MRKKVMEERIKDYWITEAAYVFQHTKLDHIKVARHYICHRLVVATCYLNHYA